MYATSFAIAGIPLTQPIMPEAVIALGCVPIAEYGTPSTEEIPDAVSKYLQYFDAVLLANLSGALSYSDSLLSAYHKMESVEFYAQLLYQSKMLGGPKELSEEQVQRLYEIRRQFGMTGKHPANVCINNKEGKPSCHTCGGSCSCGASSQTADADLVAEITKKGYGSAGNVMMEANYDEAVIKKVVTETLGQVARQAQSPKMTLALAVALINQWQHQRRSKMKVCRCGAGPNDKVPAVGVHLLWTIANVSSFDIALNRTFTMPDLRCLPLPWHSLRHREKHFMVSSIPIRERLLFLAAENLCLFMTV